MTAGQPQRHPPTPGVGRFALGGAVGFGVGGVLCGLVQFAEHGALRPDALDSAVASLGFGIMGVLGGVALGVAARDTRALRRLALAGLVGFGVGGLLNLLMIYAAGIDSSAEPPVFRAGLVNWTPEVYTFALAMYALAFAVRGTIGGAVLGVAVPHRSAVRFLSIAGACGFGLGGLVSTGVFLVPGLRAEDPGSALAVVTVSPLWVGGTTAIGGAVLGAAVGTLMRPRS